MRKLIIGKYYIVGAEDTTLDGPFDTVVEAAKVADCHPSDAQILRWNREKWVT